MTWLGGAGYHPLDLTHEASPLHRHRTRRPDGRGARPGRTASASPCLDADTRGWEVREEVDKRIVKRTWMRDWHRVENAMMRFALEATQLQRAGWVEVSNIV